MEKINFYSTKGPHGFCSNFYRAQIILDDKIWPTSEHYYQAQKSNDPIYKELVCLCKTPKIAAMLGRTGEVRKDWDSIKYEVMRKVVRAKFEQHPELMEKLQETKPYILVENTVGSPRADAIWGNGADGNGLNWLGKILMEVRDND